MPPSTMVLLEKFVVETIGLTKFGPYLPTFYGAFLVFTLIHLVIAPFVCARWFPVAYGGKGRAAKNNWYMHTPRRCLLPLSTFLIKCGLVQGNPHRIAGACARRRPIRSVVYRAPVAGE